MADDLILSMEARLQTLGQALQTVVRDYAPNHLKGHIYVQVSIAPTRATLSVRVPDEAHVQKYGTRDAAAQEYGQGSRSEKGSSWNGHIYPVNGTYLVFMGTHEYEGQLIFTKTVTKHPGMFPYQKIGYIRPAVQEFKTTVLPSIDPDIREQIRLAVTRAFPKAGHR